MMFPMRLPLTLALVCLAAALAGCERVPELEATVETAATGPLRVGVLPQASAEALRALHAPIVAELSRRTGRAAELVLAPRYDDLGYLLAAGSVDLAWLSDATLADAQAKGDAVPLVRAVRAGSDTYRGVIAVRAGSGIRALGDLRGRTFAYVDRLSGSGFVRCNQLLVSAGIDPAHDFKAISFTGSHAASLEALKSGACDGAALVESLIAAPAAAGELPVLARTEPIPNQTLVASRHLAEPMRAAVKKAFLEMSKDEAGKRVLAAVRALDPLEGFVAVEASVPPAR